MAETTTLKKIRGMEVVIHPAEREAVLKRIDQVLTRGWLMSGPEQDEFQERWQALAGRTHALTVSSATAALEILFRWLKLRGRGETVCFQANAFPSPVMAAHRAGWACTWADLNPARMVPDVGDLEQAWVTSPFQVLVLQWTGGFIPRTVNDLVAWARRQAIFVVEDASHAAGSAAFGVPAGKFGDAAVFSLAATKALHTGQGGILLTDDPDLDTYAFRAKNYGRTEMFQRGKYVVSGFNAHLTELQAALGNVLLDSMAQRIQERAGLAELYWKLLEKTPVLPLGDREGCQPNYYKYPVLLPRIGDRAELGQALASQGIELGSAIYEFVTPALGVWETRRREAEEFPRTVEYSQRHTCLPMHNALSPDDVERVGRAVAALYSRG